mmetsp:Transcript_116356/g.163556  ORF Transcript_116356/g.163556 Transcript_116356/m.163556 type:complete len:91 (+) Transcript_116356:133-405(+)
MANDSVGCSKKERFMEARCSRHLARRKCSCKFLQNQAHNICIEGALHRPNIQVFPTCKICPTCSFELSPVETNIPHLGNSVLQRVDNVQS